MKLKTILVVLAAATLLCATPSMANIRVQINDANENMLTDCDVVAYDGDGQFIGKYTADGTGGYWVDAEVEKLSLDISGPSSGSHIGVEATIKNSLGVNVVLELVPPLNDTCADAAPLEIGTSVIGTTVEATDDPEAFTCGTGVTAPGNWYTVVGTGTTLTASLCSAVTDFDTRINVYCSDCADLTCIDGNDDDFGCPFSGLQSTVSFCTQPGQTYHVLVQGFNGQTGNYELSLTDSGATCTPDVDCTSVGACCSCLNPPYNCTVTTQMNCDAQGSDYLGDDSECVTTGLPLPPLTSDVGLPIPDNDTIGISDTITVLDDFAIGDVNVGLVIEHTFLGDLEVTLNGPGGSVPLWFDACGSNDNLDIVLDDDGGAVTCASPTVGVIDPESVGGGDLGAFEGTLSAGDWTITVVDDAGLDTGTFVSWFLEFAPGEPACPDPPVCGNGSLEAGEDCDDGNNVSGDGCSANCGLEGGGCDEDEDDEGASGAIYDGVEGFPAKGDVMTDMTGPGGTNEASLSEDGSEDVTSEEGRIERHRKVNRDSNRRGR